MKKQVIILASILLSISVLQTLAATTSKPNILFAVADDWGYGHAGAYGCKWVKTPAFDRVARNGLLFTYAFTPDAKCAPSRSSILTGRYPWQLKEACNHVCYFPLEFKTWTETLAKNGYYVGMTGKGWGPGVATNADGSPRQLVGKPFSKRTLTPPATGISRNDYAGNFEDFLKSVPENTPWCFWYGAIEPHRPYEYGSGVKKGGKKTTDIDRIPAFYPDNEIVRNDFLDYAFEVEHFDKHLEKILDILEKTGQLENTIVVVTSDNGMPFPRVKGQEYHFSNRMPLAIMWKKGIKNPGRVIDDYVSFVDFAPTFLEVAGINPKNTEMAPISGRSLTEIFNSEKSGKIINERRFALVGKERHDVGRPHDWGYPIRGIVMDGFEFLYNFEPDRWPAGNPETGYLNCDGGPTKTEVIKSRKIAEQKHFWQLCFGKRLQEELYDLNNDPDCLRNLAYDKNYEAIKNKFKQTLFDTLKQQGDPRMFGQGEIFEKYPYANPNHRNFYERFMKGEKLDANWINPEDIEKDFKE